MRTLPPAGLRSPGEGLDQGRLAGAVGADEDNVFPCARFRGWRRRAASAPAPPALPLTSFSTTRQGRSGGLKREAQERLSRFSAAGPSRFAFLDLFHPRLRLARLRRLVAEALDEALHPRDLRLLALDRFAEGDLPRRLLLAPGVPGTGEEAGALGLPAPAPRSRPPPGTSGRGRRGRRRRRGQPGSAPATPARGCRDGSSARRGAAGRDGWRARGPARRGSARRRRRSRAAARRARPSKPSPRRTARTSSRQR